MGASRKSQADSALNMVLKTLTAIAHGGIYDQLGGGFHRYSTDSQWHVPHFEKMLYDNAQLIGIYVEALRITGDPLFKEIAGETIEYVLRDMTHPGGGVFSAEDADSYPETPIAPFRADHPRKEEGAFYVWRFQEIISVLGKQDAELFAFRYGIAPDGNVSRDPYDEFVGKNILFRQNSLTQTAEKFNLSTTLAVEILNRGKKQLLEVRNKRPRPHLDDKIITEWNGLMVSALARSYLVLGEKRYLNAAQACMNFILTSLFDSKKHILYRIWRDTESRIEALASDYACSIQALVDLYESDFDSKWLDFAVRFSEILIHEFFDNRYHGFFTNSHASLANLIARLKETHDNVIPSAGSIAVNALFRLGKYTGRADFTKVAQQTFNSYIDAMEKYPGSAPLMLQNVEYAGDPITACLTDSAGGKDQPL
jgi:hypothetical protein